VPFGASGLRPGVGVPQPYHFHAGIPVVPDSIASFGIGLLSPDGTTNVLSLEVNK
jgi:hypothetical protein